MSQQTTTSIGFGRQLSLLSEGDKFQKIKALTQTKKDIVQNSLSKTDSEELLKINVVLLGDSAERVREQSLDMISMLLDKNFINANAVLRLFAPFLLQRVGQQDVMEPSEELRLQFVTLLHTVIQRSDEHVLGQFMNDIVTIMQRTITDKSPDVKKASCVCVSVLARALPMYFHQQSENLIPPLLTAVSHQHSRVRIEAIKAIADAIQFGNNKSVDDVVPHLAQRLFDQSPPVRKAVILLCGDWLLDLPDRYSFFHRLIPLLLTGFSDEVEEIKDLALTYWNDIGLKYEKENESDLKDKLDFAAPTPAHYPAVARPNLGCRTLMQRNIFKILPALSHDITDWILETRQKSAQLLFWLFVNAEDSVTQHLSVAVNILLKAVIDEEKTVTSPAEKAAEALAYFVPVDAWMSLVLDHVRQSHGALGPLTLLACLIRGAESMQLTAKNLQQILTVLNSSDIGYTLDGACQKQLLDCGTAILSVAEATESAEVSYELFFLFLTSLAMFTAIADSTKEQVEVLQQLDQLGIMLSACEGSSKDAKKGKQFVFEKHMGQLLENLTTGHDLWNKHSPQRLVFETLLYHSEGVLGRHLSVVVDLLVANLRPEKDAELRLSLFNLLSKLCLRAGETLNSTGAFTPYAHVIVRDGLLPNLIWKPGRTADAIRLSAVSCLWAVFVQSDLLSQDTLASMKTDLLTQLMSLLTDDQRNTRLVAIRVLKTLFQRVGKDFGQDKLHSLYIDLLKRFDDVNDEIRIALAETFKAYIECYNDPYDYDVYSSHATFIFDTLLIHLDDSDPRIQDAVYQVLIACSKLKPSALAERALAVRHKHRNPHYLNKLSTFLSSSS